MHADDVEGRIQARMARVGGQPERRSSPKAVLLFFVHHLHGMPEVEAGAHLDLAKDQPRATADDQVDLATTDAGVRREDPVSARAEVQASATLGRPPGG